MKYSIIGAGIGGLSIALAFEKLGIDYHIYEKSPVLNEVGAGIWLAPNALQILEYLNLLEEVKSTGNSIDRITIGKRDLTPISDTDQQFVKEHFGYSSIAIHRAKLQNLLFNKIPSSKITLGKGFKSYEELADQKLKITFEDNSQAITDFIIGADGIKSKVRNQLFPDSQIRYTGQTC
ncbi:FAD-dependent monooxygenase [Marinigracilibium pacificum]|uniref:FAD-dependent monooxygenase n=1 Tax=Marinigracilibium pacificum TaxID=2729599 RepID=UPI00232A5342|nr:FAD-dependent monooxygenase [Marinigracilibium pacificum]